MASGRPSSWVQIVWSRSRWRGASSPRPDAGARRESPLDEQRDRVIECEWRDRPQHFTRHAQALPARGQDLQTRADLEQLVSDSRNEDDEMLTVVKDDQRLPTVQAVDHRVRSTSVSLLRGRSSAAAIADTTPSRISDVGQFDEPHLDRVAGIASRRSFATSIASRVLPTPPGPTSVTRRCDASRRDSPASASAAPDQRSERRPQVGATLQRRLDVAADGLFVLAQDRGLELAQLGRRRESELLTEHGAGGLERPQGFCRPPDLARASMSWAWRCSRSGCSDTSRSSSPITARAGRARGPRRPVPPLPRSSSRSAGPIGFRELVIGHVNERIATPQREAFAMARWHGWSPRASPRGHAGRTLELEHVDGTGRPGASIHCPGGHGVGSSENPPQRGHLPLERVCAAPGLVAPHDLE